MSDEQYELGLAIRRQVLGDEYVDRALASADDFGRDFQRIVNEYCWSSWGREGLTRRQRSLNNLSILASLNRPDELEVHLRGALNNGCTLDEIRETLIQVSIYAGIPAGVGAFRTARKVFAEEGIDTGSSS
ncbi:MAG: carboxymuconolactone decarboxylase family protein [Actinomycetia bacterium]|nr:carboxymuconolactone decarboxylase family protein [Actinomycetes bacterium]